MTTLDEINFSAMALPAEERARLASNLLASLPPILDEEDDGIAEALRRDAELDADPSIGLTMEELKEGLGRK